MAVALCKRTHADQDGKPAAMATENPKALAQSLRLPKRQLETHKITQGGKDMPGWTLEFKARSGHAAWTPQPPPSGQLCQDRREGLQRRRAKLLKVIYLSN